MKAVFFSNFQITWYLSIQPTIQSIVSKFMNTKSKFFSLQNQNTLYLVLNSTYTLIHKDVIRLVGKFFSTSLISIYIYGHQFIQLQIQGQFFCLPNSFLAFYIFFFRPLISCSFLEWGFLEPHPNCVYRSLHRNLSYFC